MKTEEELLIYNDLKSLGCCNRCIFRYIKITGDYVDYGSTQQYFEKYENIDEQAAKKIKENPCRVCLNILQDEKLDSFVEAALKSDLKEYDSEDFNVLVSFPKSVYIRSHSILLYLKEKYASVYTDDAIIYAFNKVFRFSIKDKLATAVGKSYNTRSNLEVTFWIGYENDESEVINVLKLDVSKFAQKTKHRNQTELVSRNSIGEILITVDDSLFKKHFTLPPGIPDQEITLTNISCLASPIFLGGRYTKYCRNMGQTPWIINNKKVTETCVQDVIFDAIKSTLESFSCKMTFSSSGREDSDVRMLGTGRPFYIQIDNPKTRVISEEQCKAIEVLIEASDTVGVNSLQLIRRSDLSLIKDGEETKSKTYVALCQAQTDNIALVIEVINAYGPVEVAQKTPIRVLHRRTQSVRMKNIYSMKATEIKGRPNLFELELNTQAGTYVKEFVHGDLGRTVPNLGTIIGCPVDIIALDVKSIDLVWPDTKQ